MMRIVIAAFMAAAAWTVAPAQAQDTPSQPGMAPAESATPMQAAPAQEAAPAPAQSPVPAPDVTPAPATAAPQIITRPQQAQSEPPKPPAAASRYRFNRVANGYLRLDNETGQVAYCSAPTANWGCETVPENRAALEIEIGELRKEVDDLKKQIAALQAAPPAPSVPPAPKAPSETPPRPPESVPPANGGEIRLNLPTQEDLDRAATFISDTWRRLVEMIVNLQKDAMRRS